MGERHCTFRTIRLAKARICNYCEESAMSERKHVFLNVNNARIHAVEEGEGPLVILLHGFPESWYSWREQLSVIAEAGYKVVAIDQRGYGQSSKFRENKAYRIHQLVGDVIGVADAYGEASPIVIGHDWGAPVAWTTAWLNPDRIRGVMGISVPFSGRAQVALPGNPFGEHRPKYYDKVIAGPDKTYYQAYFSAQDEIIDEIENDLRHWLKCLLYSVSGDAVSQIPADENMDAFTFVQNSPLCIPNGQKMSDSFACPEVLPDWLTEEDLDFYVNEFQRSGFGGPLSYYHNIDNNWHDLAEYDGKPLTVPAYFVGGEFDIGTTMGADAIERVSEMVENLLGLHIVEGAGHWIQQERPAETNAHILDFLNKVTN